MAKLRSLGIAVFGALGLVWLFLMMKMVWVFEVCVIFIWHSLVNFGRNGRMVLVCGLLSCDLFPLTILVPNAAFLKWT